MKNLFSLLFILAAFAFQVKAQTFSPPVFTAEDEVTLTVDVTGTPMAGIADAYIWIFANITPGSSTNGIVNTDWTNSPAAAKMTAAGTNKWSFKFTGTTMFGLPPAQLTDFGFLVKTKDGSKQTADYKPYKFDPLVFIPSKLRVFPAKVDTADVVTVNFDRTLGTNANEQRMEPVSVTITVFDETNTSFGMPLTLPVRKMEANTWSATFIPSSSFTAPAGHRLKGFNFSFNGTVRDVNNVSTNVSTSETQAVFTTLK